MQNFKVNNDELDLIIIGGGSAAFSSAIRANELGIQTLLVNRGLPLGGTCVNVGCFPSKHLIRAAESIYRASNSPFEGIKTEKPHWDYKKIIKQKKDLVQIMQKKKYLELLRGLNSVKFIDGHAELIDSNTVIVNGNSTYKAPFIIIATGATTAIPPIEGLNGIPFLTNETLFDLEELPESLTIIGGGYVGLETAQTYRRFGSRVRILEYLDRILSNQTPEVSQELTKHLQSEGIDIHTGVIIERIIKNGKKIIFQCINGNGKTQYESTHLMIAAGRSPNTGNIGLENAGVETTKGGHIKVNKYLQTNVENIYAVGDCNNNPPFVYTAAYEGSLAVENAFNEIKESDYTGMPWVIFTDPQVAGVGMDEKEADEKKIPYEVSVLPLSEVSRSIAALDTRGFIKLIRNPETDKLLGARIVAPEGSELAMEISLAIRYGITVEELSKTMHPYLTLSEGIKLTALSFKKDISALSCCAT